MQTNGTSNQEAASGNDQLPIDSELNNLSLSDNNQQQQSQQTNNTTTNTTASLSSSHLQQQAGSISSQSNNNTNISNNSSNSMASSGLSSNHVIVDQLVQSQTVSVTSTTTNNPAITTSGSPPDGGGGGVAAQQSGYNNNQHQHQHQQQRHQRGHQPYHHGLGAGNQQQYQQHHQSAKYNSRGDNESNINHVLLITVINPYQYTITCDLIHHICGTYGKVNRIVIFKKNGVQAMVEFDNVESAKRAKMALHGCDIYSGCCTLRIEYAKPTRLNVHKNGNDSFDYTNPNLGSGGNQQQQQDVGNPTSNMNENLPVSTVPTSTSGGNGQPPAHHQQIYHAAQHHGHHPSQARGTAGNGGIRRGVVGPNGGGGHGQHQNFHPSHHHHPHMQQHGKPGETAVGYTMGHPSLDPVIGAAVTGPGGDSTGTFHHDGGSNVSRSGPPSGYVEPYLQTAHTGGAAPSHGPPYPRQDGGHHHHPHHPRSNLGPISGANHNHSSFAAGGVANNALMAGPGNMGPPQGTVMMVYGLHPERVNCDRLFNLFCLYGNVIRIKFLRTKEGCAMVQMGDILAVDRCVSSLNKITLFGNELQISYSKQPFLHDVMQPFILPDGSPSFKDFSNNKNNRFKNPEVASKNRILPPSHVLHFFSAPFGITEEELVHLFKQTSWPGGHEPLSLKIFAPKGENTKSYSGLVTFRDSVEATEALVLCNHMNMPRPGAPHPYILRLCFSPPTYPRSNPYVQAQSSQ